MFELIANWSRTNEWNVGSCEIIATRSSDRMHCKIVIKWNGEVERTIYCPIQKARLIVGAYISQAKRITRYE